MSESSSPLPTLGFMEKYALSLDDFGRSGLKWAKLVKSEGTHGLPDTYLLANAKGEGPGHFRIYWCQYTKDAVYSISLYHGADFMFTPKMNGCSFAVGMPTPEGNILVGHANVHDSTRPEILAIDEELEAKNLSMQKTLQLLDIRRDLVRSVQFLMLHREFEGRGVAVKKQLNTTNTAYTSSASGIITFGIRDTAADGIKWRFYFQTKDRQNRVTGVHKIKK
ncbi:MAG: hypothetical protein ACREFS_10255 [Acetobacteraceae bacterium]